MTCQSSGVYESFNIEISRVWIALSERLSGSVVLIPRSRWLTFPFRFLGVSGSTDGFPDIVECRVGV